MQTIVLASASPRRSELLARAGIPFVALPANVDESVGSETPVEHTRRLAEEKAVASLERIVARRDAARKDAIDEEMLIISRILDGPAIWVLGADTVIDLDGVILGKPTDQDEAKRMIETLSGRSHEVVTGVCLRIHGSERDDTIVDSVRTRVQFGDLRQFEIDAYLDSGDWRDAAGAYRIQSRGETLINTIEGSYSNVVGLPLRRFCGMLQRYGYFTGTGRA